ncbi:hypothetical protein PIB30_102217 [Stylosanthes scabra]|uniref:Peptidase A2 domain-containing protein n=1 Tax=Stylosanthes scabra TaxID=79078 RepID=A0ABU6YWJ7_9FABA|nr:hypothetical protein [Stylosanthes scabra]
MPWNRQSEMESWRSSYVMYDPPEGKGMNVIRPIGPKKVLTSEAHQASRALVVRFTTKDYKHSSLEDDELLVITTKLGNGVVKRILVDTGADSNILFRNVFDALGL